MDTLKFGVERMTIPVSPAPCEKTGTFLVSNCLGWRRYENQSDQSTRPPREQYDWHRTLFIVVLNRATVNHLAACRCCACRCCACPSRRADRRRRRCRAPCAVPCGGRLLGQLHAPASACKRRQLPSERQPARGARQAATCNRHWLAEQSGVCEMCRYVPIGGSMLLWHEAAIATHRDAEDVAIH